MKTDLKEKIVELLEAPLKEIGVEIADISLSFYKNNTTIRLFVYTEHGATLDECAKISNIVGNLIEETDYFEDGYLLEVSSPGLDRPLIDVRDFKYRIGETVKLEFTDKTRKKITAEIVSVKGDEVVFKDTDEEFSVNIAEIEKGKIIF